MKKGLTELVFILDRSGSMAGMESDAIGGFNATIEKQKREPGEALVSTVLFDDQNEVLHDRVPLIDIQPLTDREYFARGGTALVDALGSAIHHIGNVHKYARDEDRPEKTIFIITTDGHENCSHKYRIEQVRQMIERQKGKYGWEFIFLGANIDAVSTAANYGIDASRAANFVCDEGGIEVMYRAQSRIVSNLRLCESVKDFDNSWKEEVEEDSRKRGRRR
ncbi:MAG: hypothetical protein MJY87_02950 [Fibrobacter sp.]|nr:hypothetical protein [Fibrobacter sp.]